MASPKNLVFLSCSALLVGTVAFEMSGGPGSASARTEPTPKQGSSGQSDPWFPPPTAQAFQTALRRQGQAIVGAQLEYSQVAVAGGLEPGPDGAGFHVAAPQIVSDQFGVNGHLSTAGINPTGYLFWNLKSEGSGYDWINGPASLGVFTGALHLSYPDCTFPGTVSLNDPLSPTDYTVTVIPSTDGLQGTLLLDFQRDASLQALIGEPIITIAGFDWAGIERSVGDLCTPCDLILVVDDKAVGFFSARHVLLDGLSAITLQGVDQGGPLHLPIAVCNKVASDLNAK